MPINNGMKENSEKVLLRQELLNTQTQRFQLFAVSITVFVVALSLFLKVNKLDVAEGMVLLVLLFPCSIIMTALRRRETKIARYIAIFCDDKKRGWSIRNEEYMKKYYPFKIGSSTQGIMWSYFFLNIIVWFLVLTRLLTDPVDSSQLIPGIGMVILTVLNFRLTLVEIGAWPIKSSEKIGEAWERLKKDEETKVGEN